MLPLRRNQNVDQMQAIIRETLEGPIPKEVDEYDKKTLKKVQDLYQQCLNENKLDEIGEKPLLDVVRVVRGLYNGSTSIEPHLMMQQNGVQSPLVQSTSTGLTAALAYLHSRGNDLL